MLHFLNVEHSEEDEYNTFAYVFICDMVPYEEYFLKKK